MKTRLEIAQWFESGWDRLLGHPKLTHRLKLKAWCRWTDAHCRRIRVKRAAAGEEEHA